MSKGNPLIFKFKTVFVLNFIISLGFISTTFAQNIYTKNEIRTQIKIQTTLEKAWDLLFDFDAYPSWHPYLIEAKGDLRINKPIKFKAKNLDGSQTKFKSKILELEPNSKLSWGGSAGFIFRAKHYYFLEKTGEDSIKITQGEYWKGIFGKTYGRKIYKETFEKFVLMNTKMKEILEK